MSVAGLHPFYKKTLPPVARCHPIKKTLGLCVVLFEFVCGTTRHVLSVTAPLLQVYRWLPFAEIRKETTLQL